MGPEARRLRDEMVAAVRPYLEGLLARRGWPAPSEPVLEATAIALAARLDGLLSLPFDRQPRGPLELFQEAMAGPTEELRAAGVMAPVRDPIVAAALPGDRYDLAPASSAAIAPRVLEAHLAWGVAKAAALARPTCGALAANLLDLERLEQAAASRGFRLVRVGAATGTFGHAIVFVDLEHPDSDAVIGAAVAAGSRVIAFGPHVDDLAQARARSLGARVVVARSRFFRDPAEYLPPYG